MKKIILISAALVSASVMKAQNIDPTVEVSREYEGKLIEVHKPVIDMAVPDTLHRFDLEFDYSVFENPYKGSYEFNPYVMEMRPAPSVEDGNTFCLRAGAGYTLHPVLDVIWSPVKTGAFSVDLYGTHRSYIGEYRALQQPQAWHGYDLMSKAGADFGYDWEKASVDFGASYYGIADKDYRGKRTYDALDAYVSLKSKSVWPKNFMYDVSAAYRFAGDKSDRRLVDDLREHNFRLDAAFGPSFGKKDMVIFDLGVELDAYDGALASTAGKFYIVPHYVYDRGILDLDLGIRVSAVISSGNIFSTRGQFVYPDVRMNLAVIPDAMRMYARIGGGEKLDTYSSLLEDNHHVDLDYASSAVAPLMDVTVERVSAVLGLEGRISSFFSYNVRGGYVNYKSALMEAVVESADGRYRPALGYFPYQKCFAALDWDLNVQSVRFDGTVEYTYVWGLADVAAVGPSPLTGDVSVMYNWNKRLYFGMDCELSLGRRSGSGFKVPWYADLGAYAEYVINPKLSCWLRGGNLLDMEIQRNLLYAEKGVSCTVGICFNL